MNLSDGLIGPIREIESVLHVELPSQAPFCWIHDLSLGGGFLNNIFTHVVGQVLYLSSGRIKEASGEAKYLFGKVPVGDTIHLFSDLFSNPVEINEKTVWREADADSGYSVITRIQGPEGNNISALFRKGPRDPNPGYLSIHGEVGSLNILGSVFTTEIKHCKAGSSEWAQIDIPDNLFVPFPDKNFVQGCWNELFREFADDIRGEGNASYPTFYEGWVHAELIDIARNRTGWQVISESQKVKAT